MASERSREAYNLRKQGKTLKEIGIELGGVSVERARQMVRQWERKLEAPQPGIWAEAERAGVQTRTINALRAAGFETKREISAAIRAGHDIPEIGLGGAASLREWLKIPAPPQKPVSDVAIRSAITLLERAGYEVRKKA